ncbi:MAG: hypothetical protein WDN49_02455 [Acetobacteraceae bacterium]
MNTTVNAAARLDRLPMGSFHWRILRLVGLGMFFDSFDNSMAAGVMAALVKQGWSTLAMNANFISATFIGLSIGAALSGLVGGPLRPALRLPVQPADLRRDLRPLRGGAFHDVADRAARPHGHRHRRRIRGRLLDGLRIRAAAEARLGLGAGRRDDDVRRLRRLPDRPGGHPRLRLAADVPDRRRRSAVGVVHAPEAAGIAALAGIPRPHTGTPSASCSPSSRKPRRAPPCRRSWRSRPRRRAGCRSACCFPVPCSAAPCWRWPSTSSA